jgi:hypothetical protein
MIKQIQEAVEKSASMGKINQDKFKMVLQRYVAGEIDLDEAYYDLLDGELIPMPSRCGLYTKVQKTAEDEENLKKLINRILFNK